MVLRDANVRTKPETKSPSVGRVKKGKRVRVAGRAKGTRWFVVMENGKPKGFVYGTILTPLLDGRLSAALDGNIAMPGKPTCDYKIQFEGKTKTEGVVLETSDYRVDFTCVGGKAPLVFSAAMFITEQPFQLNSKEIYQINLDLIDLPGVEDGELSVIAMYNVAKSEVRFDTITEPVKSGKANKKKSPKKKNGNKPKKSAASLKVALKSAVSLAYDAWPVSVFSALRRRTGS